MQITNSGAPASRHDEAARCFGMGALVVLEGPNEVGKTTLSCAVAQRLNEQGVASEVHGFPGRIPGMLGELVYRLHHSPQNLGIDIVVPSALQALHVAAHLDAIERLILPRLRAGICIVLDRYWWSTVAYGVVDGVSSELLSSLVAAERVAWAGVEPSLVVLLDRSNETGTRDLAASVALRSEYAQLADHAAGRHPVARIDNAGTIELSVSSIIRHLRDAGGLPAIPFANGKSDA